MPAGPEWRHWTPERCSSIRLLNPRDIARNSPPAHSLPAGTCAIVFVAPDTKNRLIPDSSTVERPAVNRQVLGSNPSRGATHQTTPKQIQTRSCHPPACKSQAGGSSLISWDLLPSLFIRPYLREGRGNDWLFSVAKRTMAEFVAVVILVEFRQH